MENRVVLITGCTASGKGAVAREVARRLGGEILSIDSIKVYRRMDIGTAKPTVEQQAGIPHHLIDILEPWELFSAARFVERADQAVADIHARGRPVIAVGGTVLYLKCFYQGLFEGPSADPDVRERIRKRVLAVGAQSMHAALARIDPPAAARIHPNDLRRVERALEVYELTGRPISELQQQWADDQPRRADWGWIRIGLRREKEAANRRINERVRRMIAAGLEQEARVLWSDARGLSPTAEQAVGYAEWFAHFRGILPFDEVIERIKINSRQFAKHQRTWLRRFRDLHWLDLQESDTTAALADRLCDWIAAGGRKD